VIPRRRTSSVAFWDPPSGSKNWLYSYVYSCCLHKPTFFWMSLQVRVLSPTENLYRSGAQSFWPRSTKHGQKSTAGHFNATSKLAHIQIQHICTRTVLIATFRGNPDNQLSLAIPHFPLVPNLSCTSSLDRPKLLFSSKQSHPVFFRHLCTSIKPLQPKRNVTVCVTVIKRSRVRFPVGPLSSYLGLLQPSILLE